MHRNETTPGRGYPVPVQDNNLEVDCQRLRKAILAIDEDYTKLVKQMVDFLGKADDYLQQIDEGFADIDERQEQFDAEKAEQIRAMREEVAGYLQKLGVDADACFDELGVRVDTTLAELRADVAAEIFRMTSKIPHYGELEGLPGGMDAVLPPGGTAPLHYVEGFGFYRYDPDADDPADGETCILPVDGKGRWFLAVPDIDVLLSLPEWERAIRRLERKKTLAMLTGSASLTFGAIAAYGGESIRTISVPGAKLRDPVTVSPPPALAAGLVYYAYVSAAGTVSIRCVNCKSSNVTPAAAVWKVSVCSEGGNTND